MFKKLSYLTLLLSFLLSGCGTLDVNFDRVATAETGTPAAGSTLTPITATPHPTALNLESSSEAIQQMMLASAATWDTLWMDGRVTESVGGSLGVPEQVTHQQVWIDQTKARFRVLSGPAGSAAQKLVVSDGISRLTMDLLSGATTMEAMPQGIAGQFLPTLTPGVASPNPIWSQIGEPLAELAFASDFAQNEGTFQPVGMEVVAGRETLTVLWTYVANTLPSWRMWLDAQTGILLKLQYFDKGGGNSVREEITVNQLQYNLQDIPDDLFSVTPASLPVFSDVDGSPLVSVTPPPPVPAGADPMGDVYFFILTPGNDAAGAQLVRLPGSCVAGLQPCPAADPVPLPGMTYANLGPTLAWSPDHKMAALLANPASASAGPTRLYVSAMPAAAWTQIAEFPSIGILTWSPDGTWISFRAYDAQGSEDYYVIHPDGTGLKNVTATDKLPAAGRPYVVYGWMGGDLIVRTGKPGADATVYLLRAEDGRVRPLLTLLANKSGYFPSPDGSLLAFDEYDYAHDTHTLRIVAPDGSRLRDLASFKTTIFPVIWSPDGNSLAFAVYGTQDPSQMDVYVIQRDGRGLQQVYGPATIANAVFSPDGKFLLIEGSPQERLYAVDLSSLKTRLIQAPGLSLKDFWREPTWVPQH